jgi:hypothetical protein
MVTNGHFFRAFTGSKSEDKLEIPHTDAHLHAVGIGFAVVGGLGEVHLGLLRNWTHDATRLRHEAAFSFQLSAHRVDLNSSTPHERSRKLKADRSLLRVAKVGGQGTILATGVPAAVRLAYGDGESVELVKKLRLRVTGIVGECATR